MMNLSKMIKKIVTFRHINLDCLNRDFFSYKLNYICRIVWILKIDILKWNPQYSERIYEFAAVRRLTTGQIPVSVKNEFMHNFFRPETNITRDQKNLFKIVVKHIQTSTGCQVVREKHNQKRYIILVHC